MIQCIKAIAYSHFHIPLFIFTDVIRHKTHFFIIKYSSFSLYSIFNNPKNRTVFRKLWSIMCCFYFKFRQDFIGTAGYESV